MSVQFLKAADVFGLRDDKTGFREDAAYERS